MLTKSGLPGWFPPDFKCDPVLLEVFLPSAHVHVNDAPAVDLTAETPVASTVHHPYGSPSGPGLFHVKGLQLPAYIQNVAHALQRSGSAMSESQAIQMAVGIVKRWSTGNAGKGKRVHPDVQAAAARAVAEWEAAKARAHAHANESVSAVDLSGYLPPHVPAGGPTGGQFGTTSAPGTNSGGTAGKTPAQQHALHQAHVAHLQHLAATGQATAAQRAELARLTPKPPVKKAVKATAVKKPKAATVKKPAAVKKPKAPAKPKPKATPGHPIVNKKKGTVTAVIKGKQVTMRLHEWHVIHVAHQQAVARMKAMKAGKKFAGDTPAIELVGPHGYEHGWIKVGGEPEVDRHISEAKKAEAAGDHGNAIAHLGSAAASTSDTKTAAHLVALRNEISTRHLREHTAAAAKALKAGDQYGAVNHLSVATRHGHLTGQGLKMRVTQPAEFKAVSVQAAKLSGKIMGVKAPKRKAPKRFASDGGRFLELAFTEALAERVPPGRPDGGQFVPAEPALGRYDTPAQTARAVNALERPQRAAVRATTLPPPGMTWTDLDRLTVTE